ncbi:hypothetical protein ARMGADRAFT_989158 [Armillaria gallica]|uniref:Uncharacterized protein n=1 Tax=Armillaria gallica TaxID=47427 RepID=A0A2H3E6D3_ARMGA|nr:hypothetical protein ARMGADRAFT_989158 [Armillaria gallica]
MLGLLRSRRPPLGRLFHSSVPSRHLVGPPDPISHLRPVIYDDVPPPPPPSLLKHPYSLAEFDPEPPLGTGAYDLQWKLQRQQLDDLDQNFWLDSNIRFEGGKEAVLASLPPTATAVDKEEALSEFYKQWVMQETDRTGQYTREWRARNISCITLAARVAVGRLGRMITFWR